MLAVPVPRSAAIERHPHLAEPCPVGWVRVDLHVHTMYSGDSTTTFDELACAVDESGLDVICITDHSSLVGARQLGTVLGCRVVVGEEVRTQRGELIGLFLTDHLPAGMSPAATAAAIRAQGGLVYVPHPFDPMRRNLAEDALVGLADEGLLDAVEVLNAKTSLRSLNARAAAFAAVRDLGAGAGSDAHVPGALGAAYVEMPDFDSPAEFLDALRVATVVGHHWDEPRPWTPRVVPSVGGN